MFNLTSAVSPSGSTGRSPERTDYEPAGRLGSQSSDRTQQPAGQPFNDQSGQPHRANPLSKDPHLNRRHSFHQSYLFHRLKPNLMSSQAFQACLLFIFLIIVHLSSVDASGEHFSDDLSKPTSGRSVRRPSDSPNSEQMDKQMEDEDRKLNEKTFLNEFAIELDTSSCPANQHTNCKEHLDKKADEIAAKHGFVNDGQVSFSF